MMSIGTKSVTWLNVLSTKSSIIDESFLDLRNWQTGILLF